MVQRNFVIHFSSGRTSEIPNLETVIFLQYAPRDLIENPSRISRQILNIPEKHSLRHKQFSLNSIIVVSYEGTC